LFIINKTLQILRLCSVLDSGNLTKATPLLHIRNDYPIRGPDANDSYLGDEQKPLVQELSSRTITPSVHRDATSGYAVLWSGSRDGRSYIIISVVAVVGACVMVGLVGFAVTILRRHSGNGEDSNSHLAATDSHRPATDAGSKALSLFDVTIIRQMSWRKTCKQSRRFCRTKADMSTETVMTSAESIVYDDDCSNNVRIARLPLSSCSEQDMSLVHIDHVSSSNSSCVAACLLKDGAARHKISVLNCNGNVNTKQGGSLPCYCFSQSRQRSEHAVLMRKKISEESDDRNLLSDKSCTGSKLLCFVKM